MIECFCGQIFSKSIVQVSEESEVKFEKYFTSSKLQIIETRLVFPSLHIPFSPSASESSLHHVDHLRAQWQTWSSLPINLGCNLKSLVLLPFAFHFILFLTVRFLVWFFFCWLVRFGAFGLSKRVWGCQSESFSSSSASLVVLRFLEWEHLGHLSLSLWIEDVGYAGQRGCMCFSFEYFDSPWFKMCNWFVLQAPLLLQCHVSSSERHNIMTHVVNITFFGEG